eukprot:scaffold81056_cov48-Phaeocystis_antarctica.AAC.3
MHAPSRYDGEWVDNVPKCGFYSEMPPDPMLSSSRPDGALPSYHPLDPMVPACLLSPWPRPPPSPHPHPRPQPHPTPLKV